MVQKSIMCGGCRLWVVGFGISGGKLSSSVNSADTAILLVFGIFGEKLSYSYKYLFLA